MHLLRNFKHLSFIKFITFIRSIIFIMFIPLITLFLVITITFRVLPTYAYYTGLNGLGLNLGINNLSIRDNVYSQPSFFNPYSYSPYSYSALGFYGLGSLGFYGLGNGYGFPSPNNLYASGIPYYPAFINPLVNNPLIPLILPLALGGPVPHLVTPIISPTPTFPVVPALPIGLGSTFQILSSIPQSPYSGLTLTMTPIPNSPSGLYTGTWTSLVTGITHEMDLEIWVDSPTYIFQNSTVRLSSNELIPVIIDISGSYNFSAYFTLTGTYLNPVSLVAYTLELDCTHNNPGRFPRIIQGTYAIYDSLSTIVDKGTFYGESYTALL